MKKFKKLIENLYDKKTIISTILTIFVIVLIILALQLNIFNRQFFKTQEGGFFKIICIYTFFYVILTLLWFLFTITVENYNKKSLENSILKKIIIFFRSHQMVLYPLATIILILTQNICKLDIRLKIIGDFILAFFTTLLYLSDEQIMINKIPAILVILFSNIFIIAMTVCIFNDKVPNISFANVLENFIQTVTVMSIIMTVIKENKDDSKDKETIQ